MSFRIIAELDVQGFNKSTSMWRTLCTCKSNEIAQQILQALEQHEKLNTTSLEVIAVKERPLPPMPPENIEYKEGTILRAHNLRKKP